MKQMVIDTKNWQFKTHTIEEARNLSEQNPERFIGSKTVFYDQSLGKTRMTIQLDKDRYWFLSIFFDSLTGALQKYSLDYEGASDSHYEFVNEALIRETFYQDGDENRYIDEIFIRFIETNSGWRLEEAIETYITAQFHYD